MAKRKRVQYPITYVHRLVDPVAFKLWVMNLPEHAWLGVSRSGYLCPINTYIKKVMEYQLYSSTFQTYIEIRYSKKTVRGIEHEVQRVPMPEELCMFVKKVDSLGWGVGITPDMALKFLKNIKVPDGVTFADYMPSNKESVRLLKEWKTKRSAA